VSFSWHRRSNCGEHSQLQASASWETIPAVFLTRESTGGGVGVEARGTLVSGDRVKCVKAIELPAPEEGVEPTLPLRGTGM
jgi:hypothetical protein